MTPAQIEKAWRSGRADTVYFFFGEEEFLRDELIRKAADLLLPDISLRSFNLEEFDGAETTIQRILGAAKEYPVMADTRLIICRNCERLFLARSEDRKQEENALVLEYLEEPNRSTTLIFDSSKPGPKNTHPWKALHSKTTAVEFKPLSTSSAAEWIIERASKYGKHLAASGAQLLVTLLGTDLRTLSSELEKTIAYVGDVDQITAADLEASSGLSPTYNIFSLTKAIGNGNKALAVEIALKMIEADKGERFVIMIMLNRYFETLAVAKEMSMKRSSNEAIARALDLYGGSAYMVQEYVQAARRYTSSQLDTAIKTLIDAEFQTRRGKFDDSLLLQKLVAEITI